MGKKGDSVPCPFGRGKKKRHAKPAAEGSGIILEAVQTSEAQYVNDRIVELELALDQVGNGPNGIVIDEVRGPTLVDVDIMGLEADEDHRQNLTQDQGAADPPEWVELPDKNITFSKYVQGSYYKSKGLAEKQNWAKVLPDIFISYMTLSHKTLQWGNTSTWDHNFTHGCCCGIGDLRTCKVDMLDILNQVCLLRMGYIGGSPVHPQTAYSISLLRLHHSLWKFCTVRTQGFALAVDEFLDPACPLMLVKKSKQPRRWRKTLASAIDAFRYMLQKEKELTISALSLSALDILAMNCPRCFGPLQHNDMADKCDYHVATDGNFQH
ncbi:hypothetical protein DFH28DRAFT_1088074 [Melampsora americana]|nr:hypothetical protein DFH28DRAFT_1088074 [Melampsora americana]